MTEVKDHRATYRKYDDSRLAKAVMTITQSIVDHYGDPQRWREIPPEEMSDGFQAQVNHLEDVIFVIEERVAESVMMAGPMIEDIRAAGVASVSYHFQQFVMRLERVECAALFTEENIAVAKNVHYALFAHEFTHYIQGISTVLGQRLILNWFALICELARKLEGCGPLKVPFYKAVALGSIYREILSAWTSYIGEVNATVGARHPLRPERELGGRSAFEFFDYDYKHPFDGGKATCVAVAIPDKDGNLVGVPLQGDTFLEGQAQNVQWLVDGTERSIETRLAERPVEPRSTGKKLDVYYTAVARVVHERLPDWNPSHTAILLCDVALCAKKPAEAFVSAIERLGRMSKAPSTWDDMRTLRGDFDKMSYLTEGRSFIEHHIKEWRNELASAQNGTAGGHMRSIIDLMEAAWKARRAEPLFFADPNYLGDWIARVVSTIGGPPIFLKDINDYRSLTAGSLDPAMFWARGSFDLLSSMVLEGFAQPCPLLRTRICTHKKDSNCRTGDLLNAPLHNGKGCHIAFAAEELGIQRRKWSRVL